jgi:hypothetical protein
MRLQAQKEIDLLRLVFLPLAAQGNPQHSSGVVWEDPRLQLFEDAALEGVRRLPVFGLAGLLDLVSPGL